MPYVRDVLTYRISVDLDQNQRHPLDVLMQAWDDVSRRAALTEGFTALLSDPEPKLRAASMHFFITTTADDGGALLDAYEHRLDEFEGVPRHWYPGEGDLRDLLVLAISKRMLPGSQALELMKQETLRAGHGGYAVTGVLATDPTWLHEHVVEVVTGSPDALPAILFNLGVLDVAPDTIVLELRGHVADEVLLRAIETAVPKDRERLAALVAAPPEPKVEAVPEGLTSERATERMAAILAASAIPGTIEALAALRSKPLEGCADLSGLFPAEITGWDLTLKAQLTISQACLEALVSIGATDKGLDALIEAAADMAVYGRREHVTLALRKMNPARVAGVFRSRLGMDRQPFTVALLAIGAIAQDFDLSMEAVGRYLPSPPEVPEVLALLREDLVRLAGEREWGPQLKCAVEVIEKYSGE